MSNQDPVKPFDPGEFTPMDRSKNPIVEQAILVAGLMDDCKERTALLRAAATVLGLSMSVIGYTVSEVSAEPTVQTEL